jgi:hypothetical protein
MDVFLLRKELRHLTGKELLEMAFKQKEKDCVLGGVCQYKIVYKGTGFCISEILRKGCEIEYLRKLVADEDAKSGKQSEEEHLQLPMGPRFPDLC